MAHLLGISGALRADSTNTRLVHEAKRLFAPEAFTFADLRLPLYDADLEERGIPAEVTRLVEQIRAADALVISTPEYNKGPPGVLKNALDWISRVRPVATVGKPAAIMSAAAGKAGGERSQYLLILMLVAFRMKLIVTPEVSLPNAREQFDARGRLLNERALAALEKQMAALKAAIPADPEIGIVAG